MKKRSASGVIGVLPLACGVLLILLLVAVVFGYSAYQGKQDYKNNVNKKIEAAVAKAKTDQAAELNKQFEERSKSPVKTYQGSAEFGSVTFSYPKTWNAYVDDNNGGNPINSYYYPDIIPGLHDSTAFALRVELANENYDGIVQGFEGKVKSGRVKAVPYVPDKLKNIPGVQLGMRFDGNVVGDKQGAMIVVKVRDRTLKIHTQSLDFLNDFNNTVLPSLTFKP